MEFLISYISYIFLFFITMIGFGLFNALLEGQANRYIYSIFGRIGLFLSSLVGTTIHELSHAFFVIFTGHKVIKMKLFPNLKQFGTNAPLGYVTYRTSKSFWGKISMFFISIGPIIMGPLVILVLMKLLIPSVYFEIFEIIEVAITDGLGIIPLIVNIIFAFLKGICSMEVLSSIPFYIFLFLACSIACHITLSWQDIKGAFIGFIYLICFFIVLGFVLLVFSSIQISFLKVLFIIVSFFELLYVVSLLFSLVIYILSGLFFYVIRKM